MADNMVKKNSISKKIIQDIEWIKSEGTINPQSAIYDDFNAYAKTLGLDISFSVFKSSQISRVIKEDTNVPSISIFFKNTKNLLDNKMDAEQNNWDGTYIYNNNLIEKWNSLLDEYSYPMVYKSDQTLVLFYSLEEIITIKLVYLCKDEICRMVEMEDISVKPEFIFSTSYGPGYNMVFTSKFDYDLFMQNSKKKIEKLIREFVRIHDIWGYCNNEKIKLYYWHRDMKDINLYGLYRED